MIVPSIATVIEVGQLSSAYARKESRQQALYSGMPLDWDEHILIEMETNILSRRYTQSPGDPTLIRVSDYVWSLCGRFIPQALAALGQGTGGIIIPAGGNVPVNLTAYVDQFTVDTPSVGMTVLTIPYGDVIANSIQVVLVGAGPIPRNDSSQLSFIDTYSSSSAVITFNQPWTQGQQFIITAWRGVRGSSSGGGGGSSPVIPAFEAGKVLSNTGAAFEWIDPYFKVLSANFSSATVFTDARLADHTFDIRWEDVGGRLLTQGTDYSVAGTTVTMLIGGFNALINNYTFTIYLKGA